MGFIRPKNFHIRKIDETGQQNGKIYNSKRYPDHGGFSSANKLPAGGPFNVEAPVKGSRSGEEASRGRTQD